MQPSGLSEHPHFSGRFLLHCTVRQAAPHFTFSGSERLALSTLSAGTAPHFMFSGSERLALPTLSSGAALLVESVPCYGPVLPPAALQLA